MFKAAYVFLGATALVATHASAQDVNAGEEVFGQCQACHSADGTNGVGPSLKGVVGRKAASAPGFRYSHAMSAASLTWDAATLDAFIADPQKVVVGTTMPFAGLPDAGQRASLIAYLRTLK